MNKSRKQQELSPSLEKRLASYTLACAAALSALGSSPAEAAVVYTSAKEVGEGQISGKAIAPIDLNHDGIIDFDILGEFGSFPVSSFPFFREAGVYAGGPAGEPNWGGLHLCWYRRRPSLELRSRSRPKLTVFKRDPAHVSPR